MSKTRGPNRGPNRYIYGAQVCARIDKGERAKLDRIAKKHHCTVGDLIRFTVKRLIKEEILDEN